MADIIDQQRGTFRLSPPHRLRSRPTTPLTRPTRQRAQIPVSPMSEWPAVRQNPCVISRDRSLTGKGDVCKTVASRARAHLNDIASSKGTAMLPEDRAPPQARSSAPNQALPTAQLTLAKARARPSLSRSLQRWHSVVFCPGCRLSLPTLRLRRYGRGQCPLLGRRA